MRYAAPVDNALISNPFVRLDRAAPRSSSAAPRAIWPGLACAAALALSSGSAAAEAPARPAAVKPDAASVEPPRPDDGPLPRRDNSALQRRIGVFTGVTGLAGLAVSGVFGILALTRWNATTSQLNLCTDRAHLSGCPQSVKEQQVTASSYATVSTYSFATGIVALAGGITLWYTAPRMRASAPRVGLAPVPMPGGAAAVLSGAF